MVLAMSRLQLCDGARSYRLRKRVSADLVAIVGRCEVAFSLRTTNPAEAKRLLAEEVAKLEARWAQLRQNPPDATLPRESTAA
jgi:hypothetical protein